VTAAEAAAPTPPRGPPRRGEIYWLSPRKAHESIAPHAHPYVVVQDDVFNLSRLTTVIVCALTSNLYRATEPGNVLLDVGEGGLPRQSVVVVSQLESVERSCLGEYIGTLTASRVDQVLAGLRFQQASYGRD
jgi:mRNA interferase MazF